MKTDDLIKAAFEEEVSGLDLSDEVYSKMLDYIEGKSEEENLKSKFNILKCLGEYISKLHLIDIAEVAVVILILIFVPTGVKQYKHQLNQEQNEYNSKLETNQYINKGIFVDKIEELIEDYHTKIDESQKNDYGQTYDKPNEIKDKTPFKIEYPTYLPDGYVRDKTQLHITKSLSGSGENRYLIEIQYKNKENKIISLYQNPMKTPPLQYYGFSDKISINGFEGLIMDKKTNGAGSQLFFWTKDMLYGLYTENNNCREELIKIAQSFKFITDPSYLPNEKYEFYTGISNVKSIVPFKFELPKFYLEEDRLQNSSVEIIKNSSGELYKIKVIYGNNYNSGFDLDIINESEMPQEILKKCEEVKLGSLKGWVYPSEDSVAGNQVMFWKSGIYYGVSSRFLDIDTMIKIASSFDDSYVKEISPANIELKKEINNDISAMSKKDNVMVVTKYKDHKREEELYNTEKLDKFIENFKNGIPSKVRVIKYVEKYNLTAVDSTMDIEFDGKSLKAVDYDIHTYENAYIPYAPKYFNYIDKVDTSKVLGYTFLDGPDIKKDKRTTIIDHSK